MRLGGWGIAFVLVLVVLSGTARAEPITVGSPLPPTNVEVRFRSAGTFVNTALAEPGANVVSPISGAVIGFRVAGGEGGSYALRVLHPLGGSIYAAVASSPPVSFGERPRPLQPLRIRAGDTIGLDMSAGARIDVALPGAGSSFASWIPSLADGATLGYTALKPERELEFNAEVEPPPTITSITPRSGSFKGGTRVWISGDDLIGVTEVRFGARRAHQIRLRSPHLITAVVPASQMLGPARVRVTTAAGTSRAGRFGFAACVVPMLIGRTLRQAETTLRRASCEPGTIGSRPGTVIRAARVIRQQPRAGRKLEPGASVDLTLG